MLREATLPNNNASSSANWESITSGSRIFFRSLWMASLSSTMSSRKSAGFLELIKASVLYRCCGCSVNRQFEDQSGAPARPFALGAQGPSQLTSSQGAQVQAETVPVFFGGEAMRKNPRQILGGDA